MGLEEIVLLALLGLSLVFLGKEIGRRLRIIYAKPEYVLRLNLSDRTDWTQVCLGDKEMLVRLDRRASEELGEPVYETLCIKEGRAKLIEDEDGLFGTPKE